MSLVRWASFLALWSAVKCRPQNTPTTPIIVPDRPVEVTNDACGEIVVASNQGYDFFYASQVFECLSNVPFIDNVATRFLDYYNQTLQFQSTLAYLKNPPTGYQQPPVDVLQELQKVRDNVNSGLYKNQYVFEADIQLLINRMHDAHVYLSAGIMAPFAFVSPYGLVSASPDGKQEPAIYLASDVVESRLQNWAKEPSPIVKINGVDVIEYLTAFAELNSNGYLEPHADWNAVMESPARDIQGSWSLLQTASFYPGDELVFEFRNDTKIATYWLATYSESGYTGPLSTAGDFYNYFVLGELPASYNVDNPDEQWWPDAEPTEDGDEDVTPDEEPDYGCANGSPSELSWCNISSGAYPNNPDIYQDDLGVTGGGVATGYLFDDMGVLSLPSFYQTGNDTATFFDTVTFFIGNATERNISKVIIDLQQNDGGLNLLALSVFKRFFFDQDPYTGNRMRSHDLANALGTVYSSWWDGLANSSEDYLASSYSGSEWVATNRINEETGRNFTSWSEFYGPLTENEDQFSKTQLFNLSDQDFGSSTFGGWIPFGYDEESANLNLPQPWAPEDIVLLTDGLCNSACAYFVELMSQQAGVKTVVVGGRPTTGPMQTASGNRGARQYSGEAIDIDIDLVQKVLQDNETHSRLPDRNDTGMWVNFAGINIRDQLREKDESRTPLQFRYEAADCRIYYTLDNVYNMTQLWFDAAAATWSDSSLCVTNSTGFATARNTTAANPPPERTVQAPEVTFTTLGTGDVDTFNVNGTFDFLNGLSRESISTRDIVSCDGGCKGATVCQQVPVTCSDRRTKKFLNACLPRCSNVGAACAHGLYCDYTEVRESKANQLASHTGHGKPASYQRSQVLEGFCKPEVVDTTRFPKLGCPIR